MKDFSKVLAAILIVLAFGFLFGKILDADTKEREEREDELCKEAYAQGWNDLLGKLEDSMPPLGDILDDAYHPEDLRSDMEIGEWTREELAELYAQFYDKIRESYDGSLYYQGIGYK